MIGRADIGDEGGIGGTGREGLQRVARARISEPSPTITLMSGAKNGARRRASLAGDQLVGQLAARGDGVLRRGHARIRGLGYPWRAARPGIGWRANLRERR